MLRTVVLVAAAYVCGSVPTGAWVGRWAGVDVRRAGSGNVGATNVARTAGLRPALLTLCGDVAKGFLPAMLARVLLAAPVAVAAVGLAAIIGHLFSLFLRFSGGKGVATALGVFLALTPLAVAASVIMFAAIALATRYISLASMLAALILPPATAVCHYAAPFQVAAAVVAVAIIVRHRDNLSRLRRGVEPRFQLHRHPLA